MTEKQGQRGFWATWRLVLRYSDPLSPVGAFLLVLFQRREAELLISASARPASKSPTSFERGGRNMATGEPKTQFGQLPLHLRMMAILLREKADLLDALAKEAERAN